MPKKEVKKRRFADIKEILNLLEGGEAGFLEGDNGSAGFSANKNYFVYEDLESLASRMNPKGRNFMSDIVKLAILYDNSDPFYRAQGLILDSFREDGFLESLDEMIDAFNVLIKKHDARTSIEKAMDSFYVSYKTANFSASGDPRFVAERIFEVVKIILSKMKLESRPKSVQSIKEKIKEFNPIELSNKKSPGGASVGVSLSLIKNILIAKDTYFIKRVIDELTLIMR
jgi:hypothetical protein